MIGYVFVFEHDAAAVVHFVRRAVIRGCSSAFDVRGINMVALGDVNYRCKIQDTGTNIVRTIQ